MVKRLFSLVVAMAIGGAPVALELYRIACEAEVALHAGDAHNGSDHHHDRASSDLRHGTPAAPHLSHTHSCDHDRSATELSVGAGRDSDRLPMPAAVRIPGADDTATVQPSPLVRAGHLARSVGPESRLSLPLRI